MVALNDANMNVTCLIDTGGDAVERYDYSPYGQVEVLDEDWSADGDGVSDVDNQILFAGYRLDPDSALYHVRNRMYHPTLGRWLQRDPVDYRDGMTLYAYVRSAPTGATDPLGTFAIEYLESCCAGFNNRPCVECKHAVYMGNLGFTQYLTYYKKCGDCGSTTYPTCPSPPPRSGAIIRYYGDPSYQNCVDACIEGGESCNLGQFGTAPGEQFMKECLNNCE